MNFVAFQHFVTQYYLFIFGFFVVWPAVLLATNRLIRIKWEMEIDSNNKYWVALSIGDIVLWIVLYFVL